MKQIKDGIYYVGVQDHDLRVFDIVMRTEYGTSYNAYLVKGSEKTALFETCKQPFFEEQLDKIKEICDPSEIDYLIVQHTEPDHSGSVEQLMQLNPEMTVVGTNGAIRFLEQIVNHPFKNIAVKATDKASLSLDLGGKTLNFMPLPMLHWPDTMYTYIPQDRVLLTCDSFGAHYADDNVFNDLVKPLDELKGVYKYYFDAILGPYLHPFLDIALRTIAPLDIDCICPGHGPVIRSNVSAYVDMYKGWCKQQPKAQKTVAIAYCSAYGYTASLAKRIAQALEDNGVQTQVFDLVTDSFDSAAEACKKADGVLLGSCTILGDSLPPVNNLVNVFNPTIHKGKKGGAFGCFGWSGEAVENLETRMKLMKLDIPVKGYRVNLKPSDAELDGAYKFGEDFAKSL